MKKQNKKKTNQPDGLPQPSKVARFHGTEDDNYCNNLATVLGPAKKPKEYFVLLLTLGLGEHLRGYDRYDFALPMEQADVQEMHQELLEAGWKMPDYNIKQGQKQGEYLLRVRQAWKSWCTKKQSTKNYNQVHVDASLVGSVAWERVQVKLPHALKFFWDIWILNPHLTKVEAHDLAEKLMKTHVPIGNARKKFINRYIAEKREKIAHKSLDKMGASLSEDQTEFTEPEECCEQIREIIAHLGLGTHRDWFDAVKTWYDNLKLSEDRLIRRFRWLEAMTLQPLAAEIAKRQKDEAAAA